MPANHGVTALLLLPYLWASAVMATPESGSAGEHTDRPPQERSAKDPLAPQEPKQKRTGDGKSETSSPPSGDDKAIKTDEPPVPPVAPPPVLKQEEPAGKKPVTSVILSIKLALMAEPSLFPFDIEVEMDKQEAVLKGTVSSEEEKAKAAEIAHKIDGVESVTNKLAVSAAPRTSWTKKQDEALEHYVKERMNKSETVKAVGFDVKSENGIISLSGKTRFQVIALEAAEAARHVPGVRAVNTAAVQITGKD
jgi:hyperosmotically inducible periplasmic protein